MSRGKNELAEPITPSFERSRLRWGVAGRSGMVPIRRIGRNQLPQAAAKHRRAPLGPRQSRNIRIYGQEPVVLMMLGSPARP